MKQKELEELIKYLPLYCEDYNEDGIKFLVVSDCDFFLQSIFLLDEKDNIIAYDTRYTDISQVKWKKFDFKLGE